MAKRRISKASKRRLSFFGPVCVFFIFYFIFSLLYNVYVIYDLTKEKSNLDQKYLSLQEEAEQLKIDIEALNDPDYLANYARENYLYSKDGEYIIQIGEDIKETTETIDTIETQIDKNYIVLFLSFIMILVFSYIILKGRKKNKKK